MVARDAAVRDSFARQTIMATLGARLERVGVGEAMIAMPFAAHISQQHGFVHAGVLTTLADSACGYAAHSMMEPGQGVLTTEFKVNFLSPAKADLFEAHGKVIRPGRRIHVTSGEVWGVTGETRKLIAVMLATMMVMEDDAGLG